MATKRQKEIEEETKRIVNKLAKEELIRLQRIYRLVEDERHGFAHESGANVLKQLLIHKRLKAEKEELQTDLGIANCEKYENKAHHFEILANNAAHRFDLYKIEIKKLIKIIKELERNVDHITDRVIKQKFKILGIYGAAQTLPQAEKKLSDKEHNLYIVTTKCNEKNIQNVHLRKEINDLLHRRTGFHKKHNSLKIQIRQVKTQMIQIGHTVLQTYDNRDEAMTKIKVLRERDIKESHHHVLEIKEFQRVLHHDRKMHEFLIRKNLHRKVIEDDWERKIRKESQQEGELDDKLKQYQNSIEKILSSNFHSVDQLCYWYENCERENLAKFKYITDVNNENEVIQEAIFLIRDEIQSAHMEKVEEELRKKKEIEMREKRIIELQDQLSLCESQYDPALNKLGKLVHRITKAFDLAECSNSGILQLLGNREGITQRNAALCLEVLDHRIIQLKQEKGALEVRKAVEINRQSYRFYGGGSELQSQKGSVSGFQGGPYKADVLIPSHYGTNDEEDEKEMANLPYYYSEMKEYLVSKMKEYGLMNESSSRVDIIYPPVRESQNVPISESDLDLKTSFLEKVKAKKQIRLEAKAAAKIEAENAAQSSAFDDLTTLNSARIIQNSLDLEEDELNEKEEEE